MTVGGHCFGVAGTISKLDSPLKLGQVAQDLIQLSLEHLQGPSSHNFSVKPVHLLCLTTLIGEGFPNTWLEFPLLQLVFFASCSFTADFSARLHLFS